MSRSRRYLDNVSKIDLEKQHSLDEALDIIETSSNVKFDQTIDLSVNLGVDPRHADQVVRGTVSLPHGTGKNVKVLVIAKGDKADEAIAAGADYAGDQEYLDKIKGGWTDIDIIISTPDMMVEVGKLGRILGPKKLMPNPKSGTVTADVKNAVSEVKKGKIEYRVDKNGIIHTISFLKSTSAMNITFDLNRSRSFSEYPSLGERTDLYASPSKISCLIFSFLK